MYIIGLLPQNIGQQREKAGAACDQNMENSCNVLGQLESIFLRAIKTAYPSATNPVTQIQVSKHADYQCNAAMALAKVSEAISCIFNSDKALYSAIFLIPLMNNIQLFIIGVGMKQIYMECKNVLVYGNLFIPLRV